MKLKYPINRQQHFAVSTQFNVTWIKFLWLLSQHSLVHRNIKKLHTFLKTAWIWWVLSPVSELFNIPIITLIRWLAHVSVESRGCYQQHPNFHSFSAAPTLFTSVMDIDSGRSPGGRVDFSVDSLLRRLQWAWNVLNWSSSMAHS